MCADGNRKNRLSWNGDEDRVAVEQAEGSEVLCDFDKDGMPKAEDLEEEFPNQPRAVEVLYVIVALRVMLLKSVDPNPIRFNFLIVPDDWLAISPCSTNSHILPD